MILLYHCLARLNTFINNKSKAINLLAGALNNHCRLKKHLSKMGIGQEDTCPERGVVKCGITLSNIGRGQRAVVNSKCYISKPATKV